ncbi:FAD-dependent oxidoreductase [Bacillus seohaeanensis]|uniref:FAD-dependent oxidoreductase n=1 Tax=Bacillus seohaeanensis TaxID=284580 RepID=A0ABW5RUR6_9BACI
MGAGFVEDEVENIAFEGDGFKIKTNNQEFQASHTLFATGALTNLAEKIRLTLTQGTGSRIKNSIEVDKEGRTNKNGIWATGTVAGGSVHTIVTAGNSAAVMNIISEINGERYVDHDRLKV